MDHVRLLSSHTRTIDSFLAVMQGSNTISCSHTRIIYNFLVVPNLFVEVSIHRSLVLERVFFTHSIINHIWFPSSQSRIINDFMQVKENLAASSINLLWVFECLHALNSRIYYYVWFLKSYKDRTRKHVIISLDLSASLAFPVVTLLNNPWRTNFVVFWHN